MRRFLLPVSLLATLLVAPTASAHGRSRVRTALSWTARYARAQPKVGASTAIAQAQSRLSVLEARVLEAPSTGARDLLGRARQLLRKADKALTNRNTDRSRELAYRAQRLLTRAEEDLRRYRGKDADVRLALQELDARIQQARRALHRADPELPAGRRLVQTALRNRKQAANALGAGDRRTARRHLRAGTRAALRALELFER